MRIKDLFTVPSGQKVTERHFRRVLISSVCSILLCMCCLVGTTWAWYVVDIENAGNEVHIGIPQVKVMINENVVTTVTELPEGTHTVTVEHANNPDAFQRKSVLYVILTIDGTRSEYIELNHENGYKAVFYVKVDNGNSIGWQAAWFIPDGVPRLSGDTIDLTSETISEESTEPSEPTESTPIESQPGGETPPPDQNESGNQGDNGEVPDDSKATETEPTQPPADPTTDATTTIPSEDTTTSEDVEITTEPTSTEETTETTAATESEETSE